MLDEKFTVQEKIKKKKEKEVSSIRELLRILHGRREITISYSKYFSYCVVESYPLVNSVFYTLSETYQFYRNNDE